MRAWFGRAEGLALLAGLLMPLAFAPFGLFVLAPVALAVLFHVWHEGAPGRAAWRGFLFGAGMFAAGVSWVYVSMNTYGNMPAPMAALAVALFVAYLSLYPAAVGWAQARLPVGSPVMRWVVMVPVLWTLGEWLRGWVLSGFPWLNLGYSQVPGPLAGVAAWTGVYGVSLVVAVIAGLLVLAWRRRQWLRYGGALLAVGLLSWAAGAVQWAVPAGAPLKVALVQGNVPLRDKWAPDQRAAIVGAYLDASRQHRDADLIVWPEAAVPAYLQQLDPAFKAALLEEAQRYHTEFLIGMIEREPADRGSRYYNSLVAIGETPGVYRKRHLVPFGEFLPLAPAMGWLLDYLHIPMSDFSSGSGERPLLNVAGQPVGASICYEDAFGEELIQALPQARILVNVSEDAWFGRSLAPHQRVQMARMRALEAARPMLRAANSGPSTVIDEHGRIVAQSPQFMPYVLTAEVRPMRGITPYARFGNWPLLLFLWAATLTAAVRPRLALLLRRVA